MTLTHSRFSRAGARRAGFLKGCLIVLAVLLVLAAAAGIYVAMKWKGWAASAAKATVRAAVQDSQLSEDQKQRVIKRIDTLADDFESGKLTTEQLAEVFKAIAESPLLPVGMVKAAEEKYIKPSALSDTEKADGIRSLQRLARGVHEKKIPTSGLEDVLAPIQTTGANGQKQLKEKVTTEELKDFLARAKKKADDANIPDEAFEVDIASELEKAIDKAIESSKGSK